MSLADRIKAARERQLKEKPIARVLEDDEDHEREDQPRDARSEEVGGKDSATGAASDSDDDPQAAKGSFLLRRHLSDPTDPTSGSGTSILEKVPFAEEVAWWAQPILNSIHDELDKKARHGLRRKMTFLTGCSGMACDLWAARSLGMLR
jgi:hypothetical protein